MFSSILYANLIFLYIFFNIKLRLTRELNTQLRSDQFNLIDQIMIDIYNLIRMLRHDYNSTQDIMASKF